VWNRDFVWKIGTQRQGSEGLGSGSDALQDRLSIDLYDVLGDDVLVLVDDLETHSILERNDT
jgi:hypothetical protein